MTPFDEPWILCSLPVAAIGVIGAAGWVFDLFFGD